MPLPLTRQEKKLSSLKAKERKGSELVIDISVAIVIMYNNRNDSYNLLNTYCMPDIW